MKYSGKSKEETLSAEVAGDPALYDCGPIGCSATAAERKGKERKAPLLLLSARRWQNLLLVLNSAALAF